MVDFTLSLQETSTFKDPGLARKRILPKFKNPVYTFGAPRIGDAAFAQTLADVPVFNVLNPKDIVTELPPVCRGTRFAHVGNIVRNKEANSTRRTFAQAPSFLANHASLNYTNQLLIAFDD